MIISTFNIKNNFDSYNYEKANIIYKYLKDNKIDILGLQELFLKCDRDLLKKLKNNYYIEGKYRFFCKIIFRKRNERTPIITKYTLLYHKTYHLPYFPSGLKRVLTKIVIDFEGKIISIYNTHLEAKILSVKEKQLNRIYEIIKKDTNPIILMGDFNLKYDNPVFINFMNKLKELNLNRVEVNEKTLKPSKDNKAIDHIFLSNDFKLRKKLVVKDLSISDHYPIIVDVDI